MMRVLAINFYPGTVSNPFPKLELPPAELFPPSIQAAGLLRSDCPDSPRGSYCQWLHTHRFGEWLNRAGFRRLFGQRKTDQNLGAPSRSLTIHRSFSQAGSNIGPYAGANPGPVAASVSGSILGVTANPKPATE